MGTNGQTTAQHEKPQEQSIQEDYKKLIELFQKLLIDVWKCNLGLGWIVLISILCIGVSVPIHQYLIDQNISNNISKKVETDVPSQVERLLRENQNLKKEINNQNTKEGTKLTNLDVHKLQLHDWVKQEVKDSLSAFTDSGNLLLGLFTSVPILYGLAFYLFKNGIIQKAVSSEFQNLQTEIHRELQGKTQSLEKKLEEQKTNTQNDLQKQVDDYQAKITRVDKDMTERYKKGLIRQIKIIASSIKIEGISSESKAEISNEDSSILLNDLDKLLKDNSGLATRKDYVLLGDAYSANSQYKDAKKAHEKALGLKDDNSVLESEIHYKIGKNLVEVNQLKEAREECNKIKDGDQNYFWALHYLGYIDHKEQKYPEAIEKYDKAIELERKSTNHEGLDKTLYNKGNSLAGLQKYKDAIDCYKEALIIEQHSNWLWHSYGDALRELHRHEEAIEKYNKALECNYLSPVHRAETITRLGDTFRNLARDTKDKEKEKEYYDKALKYYQYSLMLDPHNRRGFDGQGEIYSALNEYEKASEYYEKNIDILPEDNVSSRLAANYAYVLEKSGKPQDAYEWYHKAKQSLERYPNKSYQYYDKACYYALHSEFSKNDEDIKQACDNLMEAIKDEKSLKKWAEIDLEFDPIRDDPRFIETLQG